MSTGSTQFIPSDEFYTRPQSSQSRIAEIAARQPKVDQNGRTVAPADTGVTDVTGSVAQSTQPPTMADAIIAAATVVGVDVAALVDSDRFMRDIGSVSPADTEAVTMAVADALTANPALATATAPVAPGMQRNPAQGGSSTGWTPTATTAAERIRNESRKIGNQPIPPGSTVR